jgi:DNA replication licensing factor MCM5
MASFHGEVVQALHDPNGRGRNYEDGRVIDGLNLDPSVANSRFRDFIRRFTDQVTHDYTYRDQLSANYEQGTFFLRVLLEDLRGADPELHGALMSRPELYLPQFELAAQQVIATTPATRRDLQSVQPIQIILFGQASETPLRSLEANQVSQVVSLHGIVIGASRPRIKATRIALRCRGCGAMRFLPGASGFGSVQRPRRCDVGQAQEGVAKCPLDPYEDIPDRCEFIDTQTLKLQEAPEMVPTSEMPRHMTLSCERYLVNRVKPGTRVTILGIHSTYAAKTSDRSTQNISDLGIRIPYVRVLGIMQDSEANDILLGQLTPEDEEELRQLVARPNIYEQIVASIAPDIKSHDDIKKAIACSLFGGSRKVLPDGMRLRGDINVLLLGDPGVAKSQFLRFAHETAPISVYTSGKGSSAAGLTASVVRDPGTGEFHLEGGAMVLADGGVVCIDEFDKMREQDRVAIHEAMEQQTISVAKAGITTILNSRTSVIAAANPVFGRYDDFKSATENINFQATILSRFDLIFIIRDLQDLSLDKALANHIIQVHKRQAQATAELQRGLIPVDKIKKLIAFSRRKSPRLSDEASELLINRYVAFRREMEERRTSSADGIANVIPITVRQLEALARISEALARMELSDVASEVHVDEALRLFKVATMQAASSPYGAAPGSAQFDEEVKKCEQAIKSAVPLNTTVRTTELLRALITQKEFSESVTKRCIEILVNRGEFSFLQQKKQLRHGH